MLFFNKFLPLFFLPIGIVTMLILFALFTRKRWPLLAALAILYLGSTGFVSTRLIGWVESRYPALPVAAAGPADAIMVLGGSLGPKAEPGFVPNWLESGERFEAGVALVRSGQAPLLVFSGARMNWEKSALTEGDELKRLAVARGVMPEQIKITREVVNTSEEAAAVAAMAKERGWRRVILVTTGWHMPRSAYLFRKAGVDIVPFPVDFRRDRTFGVNVLDFVPKGEAWQLTETAIRECYGYLFYRMFR